MFMKCLPILYTDSCNKYCVYIYTGVLLGGEVLAHFEFILSPLEIFLKFCEQKVKKVSNEVSNEGDC